MGSLSDYVKHRLEAGRSGAEICMELMAVGWSKEAADAAYREGLIDLGIPLPKEIPTASESLHGIQPQKAATVDIAVNLFSFILLGIVVGAFIVLCFTLIDRALPEPTELLGIGWQMTTSQAIHRSIASIVIAFPVYAFATAWWLKRFTAGHERSESLITKRITYLVLLIASVVIICDLITLLYSLLQGEMTVRFFLKVVVILGVAAVVFSFYLFERRSVQFAKAVPAAVFKGFGLVTVLIVLITVSAGYLSAGSPQTARKLANDAARSKDLVDLTACLSRYAGETGQLPESLERLERTGQYTNCPTYDRETRRRYAYRIVVGSRTEGSTRAGEFELCAQFALASIRHGAPVPAGAENWFDHPAGRICRVKIVQLATTAK